MDFQHTSFRKNIYAIGDVTTIPLPVGKPPPKAGVFAHFQAAVVASNIASKIKGMPPRRSIKVWDIVFSKWEMARPAVPG